MIDDFNVVEKRNVDLKLAYTHCHLNDYSSTGLSDELLKEVDDILNNLKKNGKEMERRKVSIDRRDLEDLTIDELKQIDEINTDAEVIEILKRLGRERDDDDFKYAAADFVEANPKENEMLKQRQVKIHNDHKYTEADDESIEDGRAQIEKPTKNGNGRSYTIVRSEARQIFKVRHKKSGKKRKREISPDVTKRHQAFVEAAPVPKECRLDQQANLIDESHPIDPQFDCFNSKLILATFTDCNSTTNQVKVAEPLAKRLKAHQIKGVTFMWDKISKGILPGSKEKETDKVRGCVLAHHMGLG